MVCWGKLCCEILLLLDMAYMDCLLCRRLYIVQCSFSGCVHEYIDNQVECNKSSNRCRPQIVTALE